MTPPLVATSLLGSLAGPSILVVTTDIGASVAIAGVKFASSSYTQTNQPRRRGLHTAGRKHASLYHHSSPLLSQGGIPRTRTTSSLVPLDQRANFWHRSYRSGRTPYGQQSPFKSTDDGARMRSVEQQWQKNIERMNQVHEMMRRRHMEFMKKRLESEPYDVLFGWRNRLREGLPQEMWVKGSDVLQAHNTAETKEHAPQQSATGSSTIEQSKSTETAQYARQITIDISEQAAKPFGHSNDRRPVVQSSISSLEYDPIANRMVHKQIDTDSHYDNPSPVSVASEEIPYSNQKLSNHNEASVRAEFEQYKARRLPESTAEDLDSNVIAKTSTQPRPNIRSLSEVASRAKLEDSFQKVHKHSKNGEQQDPALPFIASRNVRSGRQNSNTGSSAVNAGVHQEGMKYDSALENLAARIRDVGERVEQLQSQSSNAVDTVSQSPSVRSSQSGSEELLRKQFKEFRRLTAITLPDSEPPSAEKSHKTISFKQLMKDEKPGASTPETVQNTQKHVYEILAYDPVTSEVNSTTISAPVASKEQIIGLSEALARLAEPAKFLPHLRLLKDQGFEPVTATNNMLVLRGVPKAKASAPSTLPASSESTTGHGGQIPPSGTDKNSWFMDRDSRAEQRRRRWRRRRVVRRVLFWSAAIGAVVYFSGLRSGYQNERRTRARNQTYPETEEELYRAMREGSASSRRDSYSGMRKVTIPKDKEV